MNTQDRATNWSVTINMKTISKGTADECIHNARAKGWKVDGQEEQGDEGTKHYQLHVKTPQVRFTAVKKMFPTAHIEKAKNVVALSKYVNKEETRVGDIPDQDEHYVSATKLWMMIYQEFNTRDRDGWDMTNEKEVELYRDNDYIERDPLRFFDKVMGLFIRRGYFVDMLVTNPAIRSFWKKFWRDILFRARVEVDRQSDRQDEKESQSVSIPEYADEEEHEEDSESESDEDSESETDEGSSEGASDESGE